VEQEKYASLTGRDCRCRGSCVCCRVIKRFKVFQILTAFFYTIKIAGDKNNNKRNYLEKTKAIQSIALLCFAIRTLKLNH